MLRERLGGWGGHDIPSSKVIVFNIPLCVFRLSDRAPYGTFWFLIWSFIFIYYFPIHCSTLKFLKVGFLTCKKGILLSTFRELGGNKCFSLLSTLVMLVGHGNGKVLHFPSCVPVNVISTVLG